MTITIAAGAAGAAGATAEQQGGHLVFVVSISGSLNCRWKLLPFLLLSILL